MDKIYQGREPTATHSSEAKTRSEAYHGETTRNVDIEEDIHNNSSAEHHKEITEEDIANFLSNENL
jgi:hypothetical protein